MWSILLTLLTAGFLMIVLEMFLPGGIMGLLGALAIVAGIVYAFTELGPGVGTTVLVAAALAGIVMFALWMHFFPRSPVGKRLTLNSSMSGGTSSADHAGLLGRTGHAITILRPSGTAEIEGLRADVVAETGVIASGATIEVVKADGMRIVVREVR